MKICFLLIILSSHHKARHSAPIQGSTPADDNLAKLTLSQLYQVVLDRAGKTQMPAIFPASVVLSHIDNINNADEIRDALPLIARSLDSKDPDARGFADWAYVFMQCAETVDLF